MRTDALLAAFLSTALLTACDPAQTDDPTELVTLDEDEPATLDGVDALAAAPDWTLDQQCEDYYYATRQNESRRSECMVSTPEPDLPELFPVWDDLLDEWMTASAQATCAGAGARDGAGNLPQVGGGSNMAVGIGALADAGAGPAQAQGGDPAQLPPQQIAPAPAACETVCQSHGKVWNPNGGHFGTCAFNLVTQVDAPEHWNEGPVCPAEGTRRCRTGGGVLFDCGCVCQ